MSEKCISKTEVLKEWLEDNGSITPSEAEDCLGIYKLGELVRALKAKGVGIHAELGQKVLPNGVICRPKKYYLVRRVEA